MEIEFVINISELFSYGGDGLRKYEEGEELYKRKHIMYCGITKKEENITEFLVLCIKSSDLWGDPHELNLKINTVNEKKIIKVHCSCPGGTTGQCKHSIAALIFLAM